MSAQQSRSVSDLIANLTEIELVYLRQRLLMGTTDRVPVFDSVNSEQVFVTTEDLDRRDGDSGCTYLSVLPSSRSTSTTSNFYNEIEDYYDQASPSLIAQIKQQAAEAQMQSETAVEAQVVMQNETAVQSQLAMPNQTSVTEVRLPTRTSANSRSTSTSSNRRRYLIASAVGLIAFVMFIGAVVAIFLVNDDNNGVNFTDPTSKTSTATTTPTKTTMTDTSTPTTPSGACNMGALHIDMVALFDQSDASFTLAEYTALTADIADNFVKNLNIGSDRAQTQLGLLKYADTVNNIILMYPPADRVAKIKELPADKNGEKNELTIALSDSQNGVPFALDTGGDRVDKPNVLFIFTGSKPTNMSGAVRQADALKSNRVTIVTIGFGPKVTDDDLRSLSSGEGFHAVVQTFNDITSVISPIITSICTLPNAIG